MDGFDWFAVASAAAAIGSAIWAGVQGRAAKRQALSAEHQVELSKKQLAEMQRANDLLEKQRQEEREALKLKLDVTGNVYQDERDKTKWFVQALIENNSQQSANIQAIGLVFADGSKHETGIWGGEIELTKHGKDFKPSLPGVLLPGQRCHYTFCQWLPIPNEDDLYPNGFFSTAPNYHEGKWRTLEKLEVRASNQFFYAEDGFWRQQIIRGYNTKYPKPQDAANP